MDSIGAYLRRERELRHVSLEELVQITRVPLKMLQRIEEDRFDELPGEVFARGFLRSYARALGLDCEDVLARFGAGRGPLGGVLLALSGEDAAPAGASPHRVLLIFAGFALEAVGRAWC